MIYESVLQIWFALYLSSSFSFIYGGGALNKYKFVNTPFILNSDDETHYCRTNTFRESNKRMIKETNGNY